MSDLKGITELRKMASLLSIQRQNAESDWVKCQDTLRKQLMYDDIENFLRWQVIEQTMFHIAHPIELQTLQKTNWELWGSLLNEDSCGNPILYHDYPKSSGNLIHHAFALDYLFQVASDYQLFNKNQFVFEFGGGYGSLCRLIHRLGFNGGYYIFDLPLFNILQEFYLNNVLEKFNGRYNTLEFPEGVTLLNDERVLEQGLSVDIFLATWSISEAPVAFRDYIFNKVDVKKAYLFAYQDRWDVIDNKKYFAQIVEKMDNFKWVEFNLQHLPGNHYLIGIRT